MMQTASDRFYRASQSSRAISWFTRLSHELGSQKAAELGDSLLIDLSVESINTHLTTLGTVGKKFERIVGEHRSLIQATDADKFDRALTELGRMLGFNAQKPKGQGVPDSVWKLGSYYVLLFEGKSDETPDDGISIATCRQAQGHQDWQKASPFFTQNAEMITIVVSPRQFLDEGAGAHAEGLYYLHIDAVRDLFREVEACLRVIRSKAPDLETEQRRQLIQTEMLSARLAPKEIIARFTKTRLSALKRQ